MDIILASGSPRRKQLLTAAGVSFTVADSGVESPPHRAAGPYIAAMELAVKKAVYAAKNAVFPSAVIGADTMVVCRDQFLGKPKDEKDAAGMLRRLSGRLHHVYTGVSIVLKKAAGCYDVYSFCEKTAVSMRTISDAEITEYVSSGEPLDKAGGYAIQGLAGRFVTAIKGDFDNIVGLPVGSLMTMMSELGVL